MSASKDVEQQDEQPLTLATVGKYGAVVIAIISAIVTAVWSIGGQNTRLTTVEIKQVETATKFVIVDEKIKAVDESRIKDHDRLALRLNDGEKTLREFQSKLDVAVTILQRIDAKMQNP